jgi:oxepin-CoA hydrolase/3-oxo-5,6-dehydrosuberyl-CoA semialdehyde dehydrogenase
MLKLRSFVSGKWREGSGKPLALVNPATEETLAETGTEGIDFAAALVHARTVGGPALRAMTFAERAGVLQGLYDVLFANREEFIELSIANGGNTRNDAKFDVDGATATLLAYVDVGNALGDRHLLVDGELEQIGRTPRYAGKHILTSLHGAAVHVNAFNFPAWGMIEKAAVAWLSGMPVVSKPATSTALLAHRMTEIIVEAGVLPDGSISFIAGSAGDLLDYLGPQDVLAFTGSGDTAALLRGLDAHTHRSARVNVEADSLNAAIMGPDVETGSETWQMMLNEVTTDVRQKAGQKCTAIRRVFVPPAQIRNFVDALQERLEDIIVGNPAEPDVRLGPLVSRNQLEDVSEGVEALAKQAGKVTGTLDPENLPGVERGKGFFLTPQLFLVEDVAAAPLVHEREIFGPVVTVLPYDDNETLVDLCAAGGGSLVSSVYSDDRNFSRELLVALAPFNGRLTHGNSKVSGKSPGPGTVLPMLVHGGPGRAGGGEELGGTRGMSFYMQRTAVQGYSAMVPSCSWSGDVPVTCSVTVTHSRAGSSTTTRPLRMTIARA